MIEAVEHSPQSKRPKLSFCSSYNQTPPETMIEEKQDLMISPTGGDPFHKTAHFLKPTSPSSIDEPFLKLPDSFSSLPPHFDPTSWNLKVEFPGWQHGQKEWKAWVDQLAPLHQSTWKKAGIYEPIFNSTYEIRRNNDLVYALAEKWCSETNTFIFPWGETTITLEDVMVLGGYSVLGDSIFSPIQTRELKEIEDKLEKVRREIIRRCKKARTSTWFKKFINSGSEFEHEAFLAYWLSRYVFNSRTVYRHVLSIAIHLARGTKISLAPSVLASIYKDLGLLGSAIVDLSKLTSSDDTIELNLSSPLQFVQVWAWERVLELSPLANVVNNAEPRLARWDRVNGLSVKDLRRVLDYAGEDFMWRPYAMAIENSNFPKYYLEKEKWIGPGLDDEYLSFAICLRATELNGIGTTEQYLPHRVARQFGFDQDIPSFVARADDDYDILSGKENPHIAWKHHIKEIKKLKLYIPSRLSEADVSTRYMIWWEETVSGLKHITEPRMPQKKKANTTEGSLLTGKHGPMYPGFPRKKVAGSKERIRIADFTIPSVSNGSNEGNDSLVPPGFSPTSNRMKAGYPMDEDELTISEILEIRKKHNVEIGKRGDDSIPGESSADIMMPERLEKEDMLNPTLLCRCKHKKNLKNVTVSNVSNPDNDMISIIGNVWASRVEKQVSELKNIVRSLKKTEVLKYHKKHKIIEPRKGGDSVKLSGDVQNLASSTLEEGSVRSMLSERFEKEVLLSEAEALIGRSKAKKNLENVKGFNATCPGNHTVSIICNGSSSCSSAFEKLYSSKEFQSQFSELQATVTRLESVVDVSQENTNRAGFSNC
ncbi:putative protein-serine/threonine phosphatase [Rosa chinensis]|uniref:Aminotransferase-like plant mobile domain-containing protein n=1 Tax=Rosa chinensis TaxID=74649 RepID=A0A2P6QC29_ROSCH|nr:putative protein-serine/threonine phosphatase [Rosa chinensis]